MIRTPDLQRTDRLTWSPGRGVDIWDLFCACIAGDLATVQSLVQQDPSLVRAQHAYRTPLYFAVREGRKAIVAWLLEQGADPLSLEVGDGLLTICRDRGHADIERILSDHLVNKLNASPKGGAVAAAIRDRDLATVRRLLDADPALLKTGDGRSNQPIHWAAMTRQIDVVDELLDRGADINARRYDSAGPVQLVSGDYHFRGYRDVPKDAPTSLRQMFDHLRSRGAEIDLNTACAIGEIDLVRELADRDPRLVNHVFEYSTYFVAAVPLNNAASHGHLEIVRLMLERGADPNLPEEGQAPHGHSLYSAAANGHHEIARLLLEHGANPNQAVESSADALSRAISNSDQPMIDLLCSYGAARSAELLGYDDDLEVAAAMFAANPALADDSDALCNAAWEGNEAFVRLMLRYQPDLPTRLFWPSWIACASTKPINELLFQHGMSPSQPDWMLVTPLHRFASKGDVETAAYFIDHGADLHARDEEICSTPLGWAAKYGQLGMVNLLLERGAKANFPDDPAWGTPLAWAERRKHPEIAEVLRRHGAVR